MKNPTSPTAAVTRRAVLTGAAAIGVTSALAACGDDAPTGQTGSGTGGSVTVAAGDVPVGGGKIVDGVVVTQPTGGAYKAFSAVCTHQGCLVSQVANSKIICECHQSQFSAADGSVLSGPAVRSLESKTVTANGDTLTVT